MRKAATGVTCALAIAFLLLPGVLVGQVTTGGGSVTGRVTDSTGAIVTDAVVNLTDTATNISQSTASNAAGLYVFQNVKPGTYNVEVSKPGFRKTVVPNQAVDVGLSLTINVELEVGAVTETVQVSATAEAELQTLNSTMGQALNGNTILQLPTIGRDVSSLLFLQPTAAPTFNGAEGDTASGNIAGNFADQNTFLLDGGNNTSDLDGDNAVYLGGNGKGAIPTPVESVEEFRVNTNNMTADFGSSNGGVVMVTTKRGTNQFHGSAYDWFQADWMNSNDWYNNFHDISRPKSHYNRFGGSLGGPMLPDKLGGKTYFFVNYEGERYPRSGPFERLVPSDLLRQGIIQERDATGAIVQYNLKTSMMCGAAGGLPCDPRSIGLNPVVNQMWSKYMPQPNDFNAGDKLNTLGYIGQLAFPLSTNFGVVRIDHDFSDKWHWFGSYRYYRTDNPTTNQVDIGGLLPGDTKGVPAVASGFPVEPRYFVTGLSTTISPSLTNEFHFSYTRNFWQYLRAGAVPQLAGIPAGVEIGGESTNALIPMNEDTQNARARLWNGHDFDYRDNLSWLKGTHLLQFGGEALHQWFHFDRYDNVVGGLTQLKYLVSSGGINMTPDFQPIPCTSAVTTNCLPSSEIGSWNGLYAEALGMVSQANIVATRTGANLNLNPLGQPLHSYTKVDTYSLYFNDAWKIKPSLTLNYGLNWTVETPPYELNGAQDVLVDPSNNPLSSSAYFANRLSAANNGQVYNPTLGFSPVGAAGQGLKYPYSSYWGEFGPRVSIAWNPSGGNGWLGKLLGNKATVIRAGFGRFYTKNLGIDLVSTPVLGDGFLNPVSCADPTKAGGCAGTQGANPTNAFRLGVDGNVSPFPNIPQTLQSPVQPGITAPYETLAFTLDNQFRPGDSNSVDVSIQRQLAGNMILEVGYVGVWAHHLYQGYDMVSVPWMMKVNGQTFAQAYDNLYFAAAANKAPAPQPFFESALKGSSYCQGFANCTAAVAANEAGNITTQSVGTLWQDLDSSFVFGPALPSTNQCAICYDEASNGYSNYQSMVVSLQKRMSSGLTLNANFTYAHSLGTIGINQSYIGVAANDPWNLRVDYGPEPWDRQFTFNLLGTYELPFGPGKKWANSSGVAKRVFGGWQISPIFTIASGLPLDIWTGSFQELGNSPGGFGWGCTAVPLSNMSYNESPHYNIVSNGAIGVNGDAANGGPGVNLFGNPAAVYNNFRPFLVGIDGSCGGGGLLRGMSRWNLDLGLTKDTRITERFGFQIYLQAFNVLNHMMWGDPSGEASGNSPGLNLQDPADFGVLNAQYNALTLGGAGASANYTRVLQLGVRFYF
jgi:hypothetical protein